MGQETSRATSRATSRLGPLAQIVPLVRVGPRAQEPIALANILIDCVRLSREEAVSTVIENLLLRKQQLVEQLDRAQAVEERDRIEHQIDQINTALDFLDRPGQKDAR